MLETPEQKDSNIIDVKEFSKRFQEWMKKYGQILGEAQKLPPVRNTSWGSLVEENAIQYSNKTAIKFEDITLTYKQFNEIVNQYANYFISLGLIISL